MNYIGSKLKLCKDFIPNAIHSICGKDLSKKVFCDIFAGTGIVGRTFKSRVKKVIANDIELYSFVLNKNYLQNEVIKNGDEMILELNNLEPKKGFIFENYCAGGGSGRQYFSDENGAKIDAIRLEIKKWKESGKINDGEFYFLLCALLESSDKVANVASVYGAHLKNLKISARKNMLLQSATFDICQSQNEVFNEDASSLIKRISGDILYLDPPYNTRQYGANYHLLNTIAKYEPFTPKGKTGLPEYIPSKFCSKNLIRDEFENLIKNANFKHIFLSYNNEGIMSLEEIKSIMSKYGKYDVLGRKYQRFKADSNRFNKQSETIEYLHILEKFSASQCLNM